MTAAAIISAAYDEIVSLSSEVGVDGHQLLQSLPCSGQLLTGNKVPVVSQKYRNACYVLFYLNRTEHGLIWPFFKFHTFKNGGDERTFNGLRWYLKQNELIGKENYVKIRIRRTPYRQTDNEDQKRITRHQTLVNKFNRMNRMYADHPWLVRKLSHFSDKSVLERVNIRYHASQILAPIVNDKSRLVGFHSIYTSLRSDQKRHYVKQLGILNGSFITIARDSFRSGVEAMPVLVCEGLATGLSLALVWFGEIRVALYAGNLYAVRSTISTSVVFCCDNDQWKPGVQNVGYDKAVDACKPGDVIRVPHFIRSYHKQHPTDFNDLLLLSGLQELRCQLDLPVY